MNLRRILLFCCCVGWLWSPSHAQDQVGRVEVVKPQDLKRTAHRLRISVEQLANARTALDEATQLALRSDPPVLNDYASLARYWIQLDPKKSGETIGLMISQISRQAQSADTLDSYRKYTAQAQQLLTFLYEKNPDRAMQIVELWPAPAARLGSAGEQALAQMQSEFRTRMLSQNAYNSPDQVYEQLQQLQKAGSVPLPLRAQLAQALISSNQREKARQVLDQAIADMGNRPPEAGKNYEYENFLRELARLYPERFFEAFQAYQDISSRPGATQTPGQIMQMGDERIVLTGSESSALNVIRGLSYRPELALKLLDSVPGLREKLEQLGGIDNVLSPSQMSVGPRLISLSSSVLNARGGLPASVAPPPDRPDAAEPPPNPSQVFRTLRGKAETEPESVRRKLANTFRKKEHFPLLINLAQMANAQDPDLASVALGVAQGLLPLFDNLQQRASSYRSLITASRQIEGEVDPTLLKAGLILVNEMQEEEKSRGQDSAERPGVIHPSDDLHVVLIVQSALDDFNAGMRSARALPEETLRIRALTQIVQSLLARY